ncbi:Rv2175c family DNA-binding protein [Ornithinimicrobium cryptoxanthini]|uniref:Rv2175c family DNA-binding protein n=1 Tax=Ornithinimicrobium cryptoxanthini TaxID=2934161 RepID=UPI0021194882|nr:Rv2175c family DNA-binding protein [Ornithinimicrobium cryptoxanthini]
MVNDSDVIPPSDSGDDVLDQAEWLAVPDIMELTGASLAEVKTWLQDRDIIGSRRGPNKAVYVPALFLTEEGPVFPLRGTIIVLADGGYRDDEIIRWLLTSDDTLQGGSAIASLRDGSKTEVRRRAQEMAL